MICRFFLFLMYMMKGIRIAAILLLLLTCLHLQAQSYKPGYVEEGIASYYHDKFVGRKTATGEIFTQDKMTAAHKTLPLNCWVKVTNLKNDSVVILRINDRMPLWNKRSIDLTVAAAKKLNYIHAGLTKVRIEVIPDPRKKEVPKFVMDKNLTVTEIAPLQLNSLSIPEPLVALRFPKMQYVVIVEKEPFYQRWLHGLF
jgi:rare lipoprotein A (peptidoglycan hydrolase)